MRADEPDVLVVRVNRQTFAFRGSPGDPLNERIVDAVHRMNAAGLDAEDRYRAAIVTLRANADRVIEIVASEYRDVDEDRYLDRWSLVQVLSDLWHPATVPVLDGIVSSPVPPERTRGLHDNSTTAEEVMIRTTAIDAVARLAGQGNADARAVLLKHVRHPAFSVRRAAVQGHLASGDDSAQAELRRLLPREDQVLLRIKSLPMSQIPMPPAHLDLFGVDRTSPGPELPRPGEPIADYAPPGTPEDSQPELKPTPA